jgi:hypothetical protein
VHLDIHTPDPIALALEPLDQMASDKPARATNQCCFHSVLVPSILFSMWISYKGKKEFLSTEYWGEWVNVGSGRLI